MENVIEVRYAGVVVGRSTKVRDWSEAGAFIGFAEPLPSGTSLVLKGDGVEQAARVVQVTESADPALAGMQVTFARAAEAARPAPKPAPESAPPPVAEPTPVMEGAPVEVSDGSSSAAVSGEISGAVSGEQGDTGQPGQSGGKRRRRRR